MNFKKCIPFILAWIFLAASIVYVSDLEADHTDQANHQIPTASDALPSLPEEMRGVWITYMTLDVESAADKEAAFKAKIDAIVEDTEAAALNTVIVQVRPFCDALYPSRYFPWSHILTGTQGEDPGYDPLEYIVKAAHAHGIYVHAWLNPYRISTQETPSELSQEHPYRLDNTIGTEINGSLYLNPGSEKAQELIVNGAKELAEQYDIDGIQFDDYFYPPDCGDFDAEEYEKYAAAVKNPMSLTEFRKENVNRMVRKVYEAVHKAKPDIAFGISPQGNLSNNEKLYADVAAWCTEKGYIDYICPQLYFSLDNPSLTFENGLADWLNIKRHNNLALYVGIPAYKAGTDADGGTWLDNDDILSTELKIVKESGTNGFMLYSYDSFHNEENAAEVENVIRYLTSSPSQ